MDKTLTQAAGIVVLLFFFAAIVINCGVAVMDAFKPSSPKPDRSPLSPFAPPVVTKSEYERLRTGPMGMSYDEVVAIIGAPGRVLNRKDDLMRGDMRIRYSWANSDGSNMNATFENDVLMDKTQLRLP